MNSCTHHWMILNDEIVPLPGDEEHKHSNCWGREAKCKLCDEETILPEYAWAPPGNNVRGRGRRPTKRTGSYVAKKLLQVLNIA